MSDPGAARVPHGRLGGTSIAALMGEDSFGKTPLDIYNALIHGQRVQPNRYMARGTAMEPAVRARYVEETGAVLQPHPGVVYWREAFAASVDDLRIMGNVLGPVDYKTASAKGMNKWRNGPLTSYVWQLRLYMAVFGCPLADLFVAFGSDRDAAQDEPGAFVIHRNDDGEPDAWGVFEISDTRLFAVERDAEIEQRIIEVGEAFWRDHIIPRCPPAGPPVTPPQRLAETALTAADMAALDVLMSALTEV